MKEIADHTKKQKYTLCSCIEGINIVKMAILHRAIYRFKTIPNQIPMTFFTKLEQVIPNAYETSSVTQPCPTPCDPMCCSTPGFPVHHQLPELTQTHVHRVGDAIYRLLLLPSIFPSIRVLF